MGLLVAHVWRSLGRIRIRLLAIGIIAGIALGVFAGAYSAIDGLLASASAIQDGGNLADLELRFAATDARRLPAMADIDGVAEVEARLLLR